MEVRATKFKTDNKYGLPVGTLSFSKLPKLLKIVKLYVRARQPYVDLFSLKGKPPSVYA